MDTNNANMNIRKTGQLWAEDVFLCDNKTICYQL